jgi:hypothetical protein
MFGVSKSFLVSTLVGFFAVTPSSTNFTLKNYDFGNGGGTSTSTNYGLNSEVGEQSGDAASSASFKTASGLQNTQNANVPPSPTFTNPSNEYNRLKLVLATGGNPTDTKYEVAISKDGFATTQYVQTDNTVGTANTVSQYQTYASWGGASGVWVVGLQSNTTYQVKVRALQGNYTGSAFGPTTSAATVLPTISFSVATSITSTPPYAIGFANLVAGSVISSGATAEIGLTTNSMNGGAVYVKSSGSLTSALASASIVSATVDLAVAASGYGAQVTAVGQGAGGPFAATSPFNGSAGNVGALTTGLQNILSSANSVTTATASVTLKAKASAVTPSANDYTDTLTFVAAMLY